MQWLFTKRSWPRSSRFNRPPSRQQSQSRPSRERDTKKDAKERKFERYVSATTNNVPLRLTLRNFRIFSWITKLTWKVALRGRLSPYKATSRPSSITRLVASGRVSSHRLQEQEERNETRRLEFSVPSGSCVLSSLSSAIISSICLVPPHIDLFLQTRNTRSISPEIAIRSRGLNKILRERQRDPK